MIYVVFEKPKFRKKVYEKENKINWDAYGKNPNKCKSCGGKLDFYEKDSVYCLPCFDTLKKKDEEKNDKDGTDSGGDKPTVQPSRLPLSPKERLSRGARVRGYIRSRV
ncbi:hypothetical protein LCGC14_2190030 [marine sediment metagenome]|uniref:Uncharacterized protein n=1 Tax=marine sediment metagenome TaxID=412755 RepID=A0A0F9FX70_9ZZZZ